MGSGCREQRRGDDDSSGSGGGGGGGSPVVNDLATRDPRWENWHRSNRERFENELLAQEPQAEQGLAGVSDLGGGGRAAAAIGGLVIRVLWAHAIDPQRSVGLSLFLVIAYTTARATPYIPQVHRYMGRVRAEEAQEGWVNPADPLWPFASETLSPVLELPMGEQGGGARGWARSRSTTTE